MTNYTYEVLLRGLNYILEGRQVSPEGTKITARHILVCGKNDLASIEAALEIWQRRGDIRIIKNLRQCAPEDYCIEMLSFIDQKSPIKGWLNWE